MTGPVSLLTSRRLGPLCLTQTCGAFNDNLVKNAMVVLAIFKLGAGGPGLAALAGARVFPNFSSALLAGPFVWA